MVILGLLSLAGTIINNGIVLIDKIETNRSEGKSDYESVVSAAVSRFRPIMLSMCTTVLGLLPLILSRDPLFYGLACVIAWGLAIGTVFTLVVVPTLYTLFLFFLLRRPRPNRPEARRSMLLGSGTTLTSTLLTKKCCSVSPVAPSALTTSVVYEEIPLSKRAVTISESEKSKEHFSGSPSTLHTRLGPTNVLSSVGVSVPSNFGSR